MPPGSAVMLDRTLHKDSSLSLCPLWPHLTSQHRLDNDYPLIEDPYFSTLQNMLLLFCKTGRLFCPQRRSCNTCTSSTWCNELWISRKVKNRLNVTRHDACIELSREAEQASDTGSLDSHSSTHIIHHISLWSDEWMYRLQCKSGVFHSTIAARHKASVEVCLAALAWQRRHKETD